MLFESNGNNSRCLSEVVEDVLDVKRFRRIMILDMQYQGAEALKRAMDRWRAKSLGIAVFFLPILR